MGILADIIMGAFVLSCLLFAITTILRVRYVAESEDGPDPRLSRKRWALRALVVGAIVVDIAVGTILLGCLLMWSWVTVSNWRVLRRQPRYSLLKHRLGGVLVSMRAKLQGVRSINSKASPSRPSHQ